MFINDLKWLYKTMCETFVIKLLLMLVNFNFKRVSKFQNKRFFWNQLQKQNF